MKISILVPEAAVVEGVSCGYRMFHSVNSMLQQAGQPPLFDAEFIGMKKTVKMHDDLYAVNTHRLLADVRQTDLLILPPLLGDMEKALQQNQALLPHIARLKKNGAALASLCTGAFLLAASGVLEGRKCSTHWAYYGLFKKLFPHVEVVDGSIVTDEGDIYSSGGALSIWNLLLHLVEKFTSRAIAVQAAKYFAVDINREGQAAFAIFQGQKEHQDAAIIRVQNFIEKNTAKKITVDELAAMAAASRRSFERRFKCATHNTVLEYVQRAKIEAAKRKLEQGRKSVNEVMYDVGYSDVKAFRDTFKKVTGLTPMEYKARYRKLSYA